MLSTPSQAKLSTCHPDLQRLVLAVAAEAPIIVLCGHRGEADQDAAYRSGNSKLPWPKSRHNSTPSQAVDLAPLPLDWGNRVAFQRLASLVLIKAKLLHIPITWGGSWKFQDMPHYELYRRP